MKYGTATKFETFTEMNQKCGSNKNVSRQLLYHKINIEAEVASTWESPLNPLLQLCLLRSLIDGFQRKTIKCTINQSIGNFD